MCCLSNIRSASRPLVNLRSASNDLKKPPRFAFALLMVRNTRIIAIPEKCRILESSANMAVLPSIPTSAARVDKFLKMASSTTCNRATLVPKNGFYHFLNNDTPCRKCTNPDLLQIAPKSPIKTQRAISPVRLKAVGMLHSPLLFDKRHQQFSLPLAFVVCDKTSSKHRACNDKFPSPRE